MSGQIYFLAWFCVCMCVCVRYIDNINDGAILVAKDQDLLNKIYPKKYWI